MKPFFVEGAVDRQEVGAVIRALTNALVNDKDVTVAIEAGFEAGRPAWVVRIGGAKITVPRDPDAG